MKFVKDSLTALDGESYAFAKLLGLLGVATFLGLSIAAFVVNRDFKYQDFGIGLAAVMAAATAGVKFGESSEPKEPPK
jgi:hypothetical protein